MPPPTTTKLKEFMEKYFPNQYEYSISDRGETFVEPKDSLLVNEEPVPAEIEMLRRLYDDEESGRNDFFNAIVNVQDHDIKTKLIELNTLLSSKDFSLDTRVKIWTVLLTTIARDGSALMVALYNQFESVPLFLQAAQSLPEQDKNTVLTEMLTAKTPDGWNAFMRAARTGPAAVALLLNAAQSLPEKDKNRVVSEMLTAEVNTWNTLMFAALYQPTAVKLLLDAARSLSEQDKNTVLTKMLTATTADGWNALMFTSKNFEGSNEFKSTCRKVRGDVPEGAELIIEATQSLSEENIIKIIQCVINNSECHMCDQFIDRLNGIKSIQYGKNK